jgi:hypothetical protein
MSSTSAAGSLLSAAGRKCHLITPPAALSPEVQTGIDVPIAQPAVPFAVFHKPQRASWKVMVQIGVILFFGAFIVFHDDLL